MSQVFDAYEQVYGAGSLTQSRQQMTQRLMGKNLDGSASGKQPAAAFGTRTCSGKK